MDGEERKGCEGTTEQDDRADELLQGIALLRGPATESYQCAWTWTQALSLMVSTEVVAVEAAASRLVLLPSDLRRPAQRQLEWMVLVRWTDGQREMIAVRPAAAALVSWEAGP